MAQPAAGPARRHHGHPLRPPPAATCGSPYRSRRATARWVVDGWAASRYEPDTVATRDLDVTLAAGRVLHAELASWVPARPAQLPGEGPGQLVHTELFLNVLIDGYGAPVVIDVRPAWLPTQVAEALCVLDAVAAGDAPETVLAGRAMAAEAAAYRALNPR